VTASLAREVVQRYEAEGYLYPIQALSPDEVARYRGEVEGLYRALAERGISQLPAQTHLNFRWAYELVTTPRILDAVEAVLGPDVLVHSTTIFGKQPGDEKFVSWHQDGYYMKLSRPDLVSAWVALTDSASDNGCLRVIPGSHRAGRLAHGETARSEKNLLRSGMEVAEAVDEDAAVDLELRPGEASLHHVDLLHGSRANGSGRPRIGVAIRYVAPAVRQTTWHHEVLLARGEDRYGNFTVRAAPAAGSLEHGIAEMERLADHIAAMRRAEGRPV
jgi:ectoine hydroxylase-related dioxygenase (phytanoyl-CoA dioxygenase family)